MPDAGGEWSGRRDVCQEAVRPVARAASEQRRPFAQKLERTATTTLRPGSGRKNPAFADSA